METNKGGEDADNAEAILNIANQKSEHIYAKHDGSIEDGFKISPDDIDHLIESGITPDEIEEYIYCVG